MSRIRSVHPGLFTDEAFVSLCPAAQVLILCLGTQADKHDLFIWNAKRIQRACPSVNVAEELPRLAAAGFVDRFGNTGRINFMFGFRRRHPSRWEKIRQAIFARDGFACRYCGLAASVLHCDHIVPVSRGGTDDSNNLNTACEPCNLSKGNRLLSEWVR